jgi:hypothetical protein
MLIAASQRVQFSKYLLILPKLRVRDKGLWLFKKDSSMKKNFSLSNLNRKQLWLRMLKEKILILLSKNASNLYKFHILTNFLT